MELKDHVILPSDAVGPTQQETGTTGRPKQGLNSCIPVSDGSSFGKSCEGETLIPTDDPNTESVQRPVASCSQGLASRMNWLGAGGLGANDGIISTVGLVVSVAAIGADRAHRRRWRRGIGCRRGVDGGG